MTTENEVVKAKSFIQKYWKILLSVLIAIFIFSLYFNISSCTKKRNNPTTVDTTSAYIRKVEAYNKVLFGQIENWKQQHTKDSIALANVKNNISNIQIVYVKEQDSARKLPLTSAVKLMAQNLNDKGKITMQVKQSDTTISIIPKNVYDINSVFISNNFLQQSNNELNQALNLSISGDSINQFIIHNYEQIVKGKDDVNETLAEQNATLNKNLTSMTGKFKRQRFFKDLYLGGFVAALIYGILK